MKALARVVVLLLLALLATGCPALLSDDFQTMPGAGGAAAGAAGNDGAAGTDASAGAGGTAGSGAAGAAGDAGACTGCAGADCCGGRCVDRQSDPANCGSCDKRCAGTTCMSGSCTNDCVQGFLDCNQNVADGCEVDAATDPDNCGSCGVACPFNAMCVKGACTCPAGRADCDGDKTDGCETDVDTDARNCGACGHSCGANQLCSGGKCQCAQGYGDCNGNADDGCEASLDDTATCGSCTNNCGVHATCSAGTCGCATGYQSCNASPGCETAKNDPAHCGDCTTSCSGGMLCDGTACATGCGSLSVCGGSCADTQTDPDNCGACGNAVGPNQVCAAGVPTCVPGFADCDNQPGDGCEVDTRSDAGHCGDCSTVCKPGAICSASSCQCAAGSPNDCGAACRACCDASQCSDGSGCTDDTCDSSGKCVHSATCAGGGLCCGQLACFECCGDADCSGGKVCSGNQCVVKCQSPLTLCNAQCVDITTDANNCGGCGTVCGTGRQCQSSQCTPRWVTTAASTGFPARSQTAYAAMNGSLFIWGGAGQGTTTYNTGAIYDPVADTWKTVPVDANTPSARVLATAVWTGSVMVVWGGGGATPATDYNTGAKYDPGTRTWSAMTTQGAPSARRAPVGYWTGSRVLFWGGDSGAGTPQAGAWLYDPQNDVWTAASSSGEPGAVEDAATAWSGTALLVFGGQPGGSGSTDAVYRYTPASDTWESLPIGPSKRYGAFGHWDGSGFVVWGGIRPNGGKALGDGSRFDPAASGGTWSDLTSSSAPQARQTHSRQTGWSARVSGGNVLLLSGRDPKASPGDFMDGAIYSSASNTWLSVPAWPSGEDHLWAAAAWTGSEFVIWGGLDGSTPTATGERVRP